MKSPPDSSRLRAGSAAERLQTGFSTVCRRSWSATRRHFGHRGDLVELLGSDGDAPARQRPMAQTLTASLHRL